MPDDPHLRGTASSYHNWRVRSFHGRAMIKRLKGGDYPLEKMEKNIKRARILRAIVLGLFVLAFFFNLLILWLPLTSQVGSASIWSLANETGSGLERVFPLCLEFAFFASLIFVVLSALELLRNKKSGNYFSALYFLAYEIALFVYQIIYHYLGLNLFVLVILTLVVVTAAFALSVRANALTKPESVTESQVNPESKKSARALLIIVSLGLLVLLLCQLFVPLYVVGEGSSAHSAVLGQILFATNAFKEDSAYCLVNLVLFIGVFLYFVSSLSFFWSDKKHFVRLSKRVLYAEIAVSFEFFMLGYVIQFVYSLQGFTSNSLSFIPFVVFCLMALPYSIFKGRFDVANGLVEAPKKGRHHFENIEPLIYLILVTAVTVISLFFNILDVHFTSQSYSEDIQLTGFKLLTDYPSLSSGYQIMAFGIIVMLICSGIGLILCLSAFFSHYKHFGNLSKAVTFVNAFFIFLFGLSGLYFSIASEIMEESTIEVIHYYNPSFSATYSYSIRSDVLYCLFIDVAIIAVMIVRKALNGEKGNLEVEAASIQGVGGGGSPSPLGSDEVTETNFDPCPAFSEIDSKDEFFVEDLSKRRSLAEPTPSLNGLVRFVVQYAKDCRLHLSYNYEDMATFVSGLGACRLTILQGMSGTGKTSLPKIFSEAIDANCDIVEVESSWKDKNELLGYYNEFSRKYTPKKFTQALYKAALNPEIPTFIVLDEMNLSRIEYYFSDFLSLMENEEGKRELKLLNINLRVADNGVFHDYRVLAEGHTIKIPSNVWFVGTANRDESTFVISDKVYDRAHTMNFTKRAPKVRDYDDPIPQRFYTAETLLSLFNSAKSKGTFDAENNETIKNVEALLSPFNISFGNRILKQIEDFVDIYEECFPGKNVEAQAVETILLSKVVSKLEVKTIDDKEGLVKEFADLGLNRCADFISKLNED